MDVSRLPDRPFTFREARDLGWTRKRVDNAVRNGQIRRVLHGVYARSDVPDTIHLRATAVALVTKPHSVVCDRTAAWIHGVDVLGYADHDVLPPIETCVLRGQNPTSRAGIDGRTRDLLDHDLMAIDGLLLTTPLRTAMDLGCALGRHRAMGALDGFMHVCGVTRTETERELPRYFRRRGVIQLRELIPLADGRSESMRESWVRLKIHDAGLPAPEVQFWITIDGVRKYRLDLAYPNHQIAVEYDGEEFHRRTEEQRENDRKRRMWLSNHGWTVIVIDKHGISTAAEDAWIGELREALKPRTRRLRWAGWQ